MSNGIAVTSTSLLNQSERSSTLNVQLCRCSYLYFTTGSDHEILYDKIMFDVLVLVGLRLDSRFGDEPYVQSGGRCSDRPTRADHWHQIKIDTRKREPQRRLSHPYDSTPCGHKQKPSGDGWFIVQKTAYDHTRVLEGE